MKEAKGRPNTASRTRFHDCERMVDYVSVCGKFSCDDEKQDLASACRSGWIRTREVRSSRVPGTDRSSRIWSDDFRPFGGGVIRPGTCTSARRE